MKRLFQMKHKLKAAVALVVIMLLLLLNNMTGRRNFVNLRQAIASIYEDRLIPATYIFGLSDHLYQNRLLAETEAHNPALQQRLAEHDRVIAELIRSYETTYLTQEEQQQWQLFKERLHAYNQVRTGADAGVAVAQFNGALQHLNALSRIQAGEGRALHRSSRYLLDGTTTMATFELSLVIVLGILAVFLISLPDRPLTGRKPEGYSLN